jgi:hypothetical protein
MNQTRNEPEIEFLNDKTEPSTITKKIKSKGFLGAEVLENPRLSLREDETTMFNAYSAGGLDSS